MRDESLYLQDIVEAADAVLDFLKGTEKQEFLRSHLLRSAVNYQMIIIGEAASRLSDSFRQSHAEIGWSKVVGFRNLAVHTYFGVNWETVWNAAMYDAPTLGQQVAHILKEEFPEQEGEDS